MNDRPRASAAVLRAEGREVLMVRHQRADGTEYWQLPGGGVEPDESLEATAMRDYAKKRVCTVASCGIYSLSRIDLAYPRRSSSRSSRLTSSFSAAIPKNKHQTIANSWVWRGGC